MLRTNLCEAVLALQRRQRARGRGRCRGLQLAAEAEAAVCEAAAEHAHDPADQQHEAGGGVEEGQVVRPDGYRER